MDIIRRLFRFVLQTIGLLTVIGIVLAGIGALLAPRLLQVEDTLEKADYIVPLAGDWHRYIKAAELYKAGLAPKILLSNSRVGKPNRLTKLREEMGIPRTDPREFRARLLAHLGVPGNAIDAFGEGHISTVEEAEALRGFLKGKPARFILVTSPYHTRRARMIFRNVMPDPTFMVTAPPGGPGPRRRAGA
jgi:uncharacterized SAM-binding protein YcdF (DUF218 family)